MQYPLTASNFRKNCWWAAWTSCARTVWNSWLRWLTSGSASVPSCTTWSRRRVPILRPPERFRALPATVTVQDDACTSKLFQSHLRARTQSELIWSLSSPKCVFIFICMKLFNGLHDNRQGSEDRETCQKSARSEMMFVPEKKASSLFPQVIYLMSKWNFSEISLVVSWTRK